MTTPHRASSVRPQPDDPAWNDADFVRIASIFPHGIFLLDPAGQIIHANPAALHSAGLSLDDLQTADGSSRLLPPAGEPHAAEQRLLSADGKYRWFLLRYTPIRNASGALHRWYVDAFDIDIRKQAEALWLAEKRSLEMLAGGSTLHQVLDNICRSIDEQIAPSVATILLIDADGSRLWPAAGPHVNPGWTSAITPLPVCDDIGLCGTAAFRKSRVIVPDVAQEANWREKYRRLALDCGIRAAWSQPILTGTHDVLGTFAIYSPVARIPTAADLALIEGAGRIAQIAIERQRAQTALADANAELEAERDRLRLLVEVQGALVPSLDLQTLLAGLAPGLQRVTGCDFIGLSLPGSPGEPLRQHFVHYCGAPGNLQVGMLVPLHGSATGKAFRTRKLVCLDNPAPGRPDPEIYGTPEGREFYRLLLDEGIPSGYFLPLLRDEQVIAVMQLTKYAGKALKPQEAQFLTALASHLSTAVSNALEHEALVASRERLAREQVYLREEIARTSMFEEIVGSSSSLRAILDQVSRVAPTDSTVLIHGETGTGKELLARAIHNRSRRAGRPFVRMNCAAIPSALIASELFGHEKGAFTGALQRRIGRFESADGGTIFLDEVGEIPHETQVSLLRVLQEREFERVGGAHAIRVDVRVLAATNRDLLAAVEEGRFRKDLFYRLNVFPLEVPPLRRRSDDIPLLLEYLVDRYARQMGKEIRSVSRRTIQLFQEYDWPGNVRELQNVIERAVILCDGPTFSVDPTWLRPAAAPPQDLAGDLVQREKALIEAALRETGGRISGSSGAAAKLGLPRQTLESRIRKLGIDHYRFKRSE